MASLNLTIEDCSPLLTYAPAGAWADSSTDDPLAQSYSGQSYHSTKVQGATATIKFHGTGISILGGRRSGYGTYSITVDEQTIASGDANSSEDVVQQTLGTISGLSNGDHTAVVTNTGSTIDIDVIMVLDQIGVTGSVLSKKIFDDADPAMSYLPSGSAWETNNKPTFQSSTLHFSQTPDASVSLPFSGDALAIYGTVSPDHANIRITIDNDVVVLPGGSGGGVSQLHTQVLLYYRSGLGSGQHTFSLSGDSQGSAAPFIDLDSVSVFSAVSSADSNVPSTASNIEAPLPTGTAESSTRPDNNSSTHGNSANKGTKHTQVGVIAGSVVGAVVVLCLLLAFCLFFVRRRRRQNSKQVPQRSVSPISPQLPMQYEPRAMEAGLVSIKENAAFIFPPEPAAVARHSIAPSYYGSPLSGTPTHSRDTSTMSSSSGTPLIRSNPMPKRLPGLPRKPVPLAFPNETSVMMETPRKVPTRPVRRPTFIDFNGLQ